jgi:DNA-binding NarL/FixJ family response regulator
MSQAKSVLVVEDQAEVRGDLREMLVTGYGARRVVEAASVAEGRARIDAAPAFDLALVDLGLPDGSGLALVRHLVERHPSTCVIVATIFDDDEHLFPALAAGAQGYLLKDLPPEAWLRHLRALDDGVPALSPSIARRVLEYFRRLPLAAAEQAERELARLTPRETEVLGYIGKGLRVSEVAEVLGLRESTVGGYVKDIYRKLNICSRAEAAVEAVRRGLV